MRALRCEPGGTHETSPEMRDWMANTLMEIQHLSVVLYFELDEHISTY
jgi:hypothetical protein